MYLYRCLITLMEATFFSSREISDLYQTEPLIGNYALAYAMGFCRSAWHNDGTIGYRFDLSELNEQGLYIMPAIILGTPIYLLRRFNAQTDGYWSAFGAGVIVARTPEGWSRKDGQHWITRDTDGTEKRIKPTNRPQTGRIRLLAASNQALTYVFSREPIAIPRYIRLGKFMSKAHIESSSVTIEDIETRQDHPVTKVLLNPADLPADTHLTIFDLINVPPTPLIRNAVLTGNFYKVRDSDVTHLPQGMAFNVEQLP